jgi:hypothetical protein
MGGGMSGQFITDSIEAYSLQAITVTSMLLHISLQKTFLSIKVHVTLLLFSKKVQNTNQCYSMSYI